MIQTLAEMLAADERQWGWVYCQGRSGQPCSHCRPMRVADLAWRFTPRTTMRYCLSRMRCMACGHLGATFRAPSWGGLEAGWQNFPHDWNGWTVGTEPCRCYVCRRERDDESRDREQTVD